MSSISSTLRVKKLGMTDCLSRLPLQDSNAKSIDHDMMVFSVEKLSHTNHETLLKATKKDQQLQNLKQVI